MSEGSDNNATPVRSVARAADLLLELGQKPRRLADLSSSTELSKATVHRLLSTLKTKGLVVQDQVSGLYSLGPACFKLMSEMVHGVAGFALDSEDILERLRRETDETVTIHIRVGTSRLCIEELPSPNSIRYTSGIGQAAPIQVGSAGKTLLAFLSPEERDEVVSSLRPVAMNEGVKVDLKELRSTLERIARVGYATSEGERVVGATAVSAPILDDTGRVIAALSVLGPTTRIDQKTLDRHAELACKAAAEISARVYASPERQL